MNEDWAGARGGERVWEQQADPDLFGMPTALIFSPKLCCQPQLDGCRGHHGDVPGPRAHSLPGRVRTCCSAHPCPGVAPQPWCGLQEALTWFWQGFGPQLSFGLLQSKARDVSDSAGRGTEGAEHLLGEARGLLAHFTPV